MRFSLNNVFLKVIQNGFWLYFKYYFIVNINIYVLCMLFFYITF